MSFDRVQLAPKTKSEDEVEKPISFRSRTAVEPEADTAVVINPAEETNMLTGISRPVAIGVIMVMVLLGIGSGYGVARLTAARGTSYQVETAASPEEVENKIQVGAIFGVPDEKTFRDDAEGVLVKGGLSGEGSHTLLRSGGESQNVYLTSSVVDLDQFANTRVRVWGETFKGQKAGWLMDVGRLEVKELSAAKPDWYQENNE